MMRCLSIADAAAKAGHRCLFLCASGDMEEQIRGRGHEIRVFGGDHRHMEEDGLAVLIKELHPAAVFVDSYFVTEEYLKEIKKCCGDAGSRLVYINDDPLFPFPCDILLNYNIGRSEEDYRKLYGNDLPRLLLGTGYAPLRQEFSAEGAGKIRERAEKVFVSTGGADPGQMAEAILDALGDEGPEYHFVLGPLNPALGLLKEKAKGKRAVLHENVREMAALMRSCDLALSASGSTLYELCAIRLPTLTYILADNQIALAEGFSARGIMKNCGDIRELGNKKLADRLLAEAEKLSGDPEERRRMAEAMAGVTDGHGAERIVDALFAK